MAPPSAPRRKARPATSAAKKGTRPKPAPKRKSMSNGGAERAPTTTGIVPNSANPDGMPPLVGTVMPVPNQNNNGDKAQDNGDSLLGTYLGPNGSPTGGGVTINGNNVSPGSHHSDLTVKTAVSELHQKDQASRAKWNESDMISLCRNRTNNSVWNICKTPKFNSTGNKIMESLIHAYIKRELDMPEADFERSWPLFKGVVTEALRTKRSTTVQGMKQRFFSECTK